MKVLTAVFATDGPNRDDSRIAVRAFPPALLDNCVYGMPSNLSHDSWRLAGWIRPTAVYIEPGLTRFVGVCELPETEDEKLSVQEWSLNAQNRRYANQHEEINELRNLVKDYASTEAKHCLTECVSLFEKGLAAKVFTDLYKTAQNDKDGLVPLAALDPLGAGVFKVGKLAVSAHSFFRRSLSRLNSINAPFLDRLQGLHSEGYPAKIALDWNLVGLASSYHPHMEFEYWWGPKFDDDLAKIDLGVTRHEASDTDRTFYGLSHTEFWWHSRDGLHTLEAEEVRDSPAHTEDESVEGYYCRYVHSIIDESDGKVMHFDGAMRGYSEEAMIDRLDCDIKTAGRNSDYTKLWRLDSPIEVPQWKALLNDYYRDNRLVGEYLGAEPEPAILEKTATDTLILDKVEGFNVLEYVPHLLAAGSGIRLSLSFHPRHVEKTVERQALPLLSIEARGEHLDVFESTVIELRKLLNRQGHSLILPDEFFSLHPKDLHHDFGILAHGDVLLQKEEILNTTLSGIKTLVSIWHQKNTFGSVAFTLAFPIDESLDVYLGVIGHIEDICAWLEHPLCLPPIQKEKLFYWVEEVANFLGINFPDVSEQSPFLPMVTPFSGSLMRRKHIENVRFESNEDGIKWNMSMDDIDAIPGLMEAMERGAITPAMCCILKESRCSKCKGNYSRCGCSKTLDEEIYEEISDIVAIEGVWSNANTVTIGNVQE